RHFWLLPTDFSKEIKIFLLGNGCFNYQTTSVISVNSVHSVQKTQLKYVFCMQVLQQPPFYPSSSAISFQTNFAGLLKLPQRKRIYTE
ncbi:MAG: hypothetical protein IKB25_14570, partial [Lentisphaeria bacterium]|nr:hypothetical protein [Lentisphaeria bacterium]